MKKIILCLSAAVFSFTACMEKDTPIDVEKHTTTIEWVNPNATTIVLWPNPETKEMTARIPVRAIGFEKDYDREFFLVQTNLMNGYWQASTGMSGQSYESVDNVPFILPAGQMETEIEIKLLHDYPRLNLYNNYTHSIAFGFMFKPGNELIGLENRKDNSYVNNQVTIQVKPNPATYGGQHPLSNPIGSYYE